MVWLNVNILQNHVVTEQDRLVEDVLCALQHVHHVAVEDLAIKSTCSRVLHRVLIAASFSHEVVCMWIIAFTRTAATQGWRS